MQRIALVALVALVAAAPLVAPAWAGPGPRGPGASQRLQEQLGLTDEQAQAIRDVHARQRDTVRQLGRRAAVAQAELKRLTLAGADDATLQTTLAELREVQAQLVQLRVEALREMAPLLTEEQKQKLAEMRSGRGPRRPAPAIQG